ncbi:MAG: hypothetical protein E7228_06770 [Clostridiales bacterium]|nr:hypothetical protein [Clostridiales bacterium]
MFENPAFMCIDAGGENCPCSLAESGNCIVCGRLSGQDCSGCRWHGVCIYNEYIQGGRKIKNNREEKEVPIVEMLRYDDTLFLGIEVGKGFALKCYPGGTYVFLRARDREQFFNVPISVMRADVEKGIIYLLVKCFSAKTKALCDAEGTVLVRGPYKNGVFGINELYDSFGTAEKEGRRGKLLIVSRSAGIAPAEKLIQVFGEKHDITLMADLSNMSSKIIEKHIVGKPAYFYEMDLTDTECIEKLGTEISCGGYDGIAVFTSDYYITQISELCKAVGFNNSLVISNNFNLCCGEGVCGACSIAGKNGETIKLCKCRLSGEDILSRKVIYK